MMQDPSGALFQQGYLILFLWVAAEQIGLPIPAAPAMLAAGVELQRLAERQGGVNQGCKTHPRAGLRDHFLHSRSLPVTTADHNAGGD